MKLDLDQGLLEGVTLLMSIFFFVRACVGIVILLGKIFIDVINAVVGATWKPTK